MKQEIDELKAKLAHKDHVIATVVEETVVLKKDLGLD